MDSGRPLLLLLLVPFLLLLLLVLPLPLLRSVSAAAAAAPAAGSAPLEDFLSFRTVSWLVSASAVSARRTDDDRLAWLEWAVGRPSVWTAVSPSFAPVCACRQWTDDAGTLLSDLTFSSDGTLLFFTEAPNDGANPRALVAPPVPRILSVRFGAENQTATEWAAGVRLAAVRGAVPVAVTAGGRAVSEFSSSPSGGHETVLFTLQADQGSIGALSWSPDGSLLAFANDRGDHSLVGLFRRGSAALEWVDPGFLKDAAPAWCPGTGTGGAAGAGAGAVQHLAFYRAFEVLDANGRTKGVEFEVRRAAVGVTPRRVHPSELVFAERAPGAWPVAYGFGVRPLSWTDDCATVLFPYEGSGWLRVRAADTARVAVRDITPDGCETQDYIVLGGTLFSSHNCHGLDGLGVAQTRVADGARADVVLGTPQRIYGMADGGFGLAPLRVGGGVCFVASTHNTSTHVECWLKGENRTRAVSSGAFAASRFFLEPALVEFPSLDKLFTIHAQLFLPPSARQKQRSVPPAGVIFTHGGPMRQMYCALHFSGTYAQLFGMNQFLASQLGFALLSVNYRMGVGYGRAFRLCDECGAYGGREYLDVLAGNRWLAANASLVDPARIGIHGLSYGGLNTLQALARNPDRWAAGVANAPVFNWISTRRAGGSFLYEYAPAMPALAMRTGPMPNFAGPAWFDRVNDNIREAFFSSPAAFVANLTSPLLLIQGDSDRNVDVQESIGLVWALRSMGRTNFETRFFPNEMHGLALFENELAAAQATVDFLEKHLGK